MQILDDSLVDIAAFAGDGDTIVNAKMRKAANENDAAFVKQLSKSFLFFSSFSVIKLLAAITSNLSTFK